MSFLPIDKQQESEQMQQQTTNFPAGEAPPTTGGSAGDEGGGAAPKTASSGTPTQFGSSASKLGAYLSANAPQIQGQAQKVAGNLNQQYGQLQGNIQNASTQFGQQVQQGYTAPNQDVVNQAVSNPTQFTATPDNLKAFQAQYNNTYTGPQNFESSTPYGEVQGQVNSAVQNAGLLNTRAGLQDYLGRQQTNPTRASSMLDAVLLQGNPQARQQVEQAAGQFKGLTDQFGQAVTGANKTVQDAQKTAQGAQDYARNALSGATTNLGNTVNQQYQTAIQKAQQQNTDISNQLKAQSWDPNILAPQLGITPEQLTQLAQAVHDAQTSQYMTGHNFGAASKTAPVDLLGYLQQGNPTDYINAGNVATPEQYAQATALQQLAGGQLPEGFALNPAMSQLAGTAPSNLNMFNYDAALGNTSNQGAFQRNEAQSMANYLTDAANAEHEASKSHTFGSNFLNKIALPIAKTFVNPNLSVPQQIEATKTGAKKAGI